MSGDPLRLRFASLDYLDRTRALIDGSVRPDGVELDCIQLGPYELFQRVAQKVEFDVAEMSASTYMSLVSQGDDRYVGLPVFLSRHFRHGYIFVHGDSDVREPGDLVGRRVGVPEYEMTAALWQRAVLQHDFGVRPEQITWVQGGEFTPGFVERQKTPLPPEIVIEFAPPDRTLHDMVATGEIDAVMCPHRPVAMGDGSGRVRRLFPDFPAVEKEYYRRTGFFPIMHLTLMRRDLYEAHPEVAVALVRAFAEAKRRGWQRMLELGGLAVMLPWLTEDIEEITEVMGPNHWRYGFAENREILAAMCRYSFEQGLSVRALEPEELFAPATHDLAVDPTGPPGLTMAPLDGQIALVTGAAQGIGRAIAHGLAEAGASVVCSDIAPVPTTEEIRARGGTAHDLRLDISDEDSVTEAIAFCAGVGGIDILVNNAGIFPRSPVLEMDMAEWDRVIAVNLRGTVLCARAAAIAMRAQGRGGRIVNITSGAAFVPTAQSAHYAASKAGIVALTRVMALELAADQISVNAVAPGLTDTAQPRSFYSEDDLAAFAARIPAGRLGQPDDVVPAVLLLCGAGAAYITGQTLHVNGGLYMP